MLFWFLFLAFLLVLMPLPHLWVERVIRKHSVERSDSFPAPGGEIARALLDAHGLAKVKIETATDGDHYDPDAKVVRLAPPHFQRRSLAAVVIAAHEVGHAIQDAEGYAPLARRTKLARFATRLSKVAIVVMLLAPLLVLATKSPNITLIETALSATLFVAGVGLHMLSLPVEFDASFKRALPMLQKAGYIRKEDLRPARRILRAAALTYVATAAMDLFNIARWYRILRR